MKKVMPDGQFVIEQFLILNGSKIDLLLKDGCIEIDSLVLLQKLREIHSGPCSVEAPNLLHVEVTVAQTFALDRYLLVLSTGHHVQEGVFAAIDIR